MSSYLQRLALGVMQPARTIHPMVGSVFSPQHHASPREALPLGEQVLASSRTGSDSTSRQEEIKDTFFAHRHESVVTSRGQEPNRDPEFIYTPLLPQVETLQTKTGQADTLSPVSEEKPQSSNLREEARAERMQEPEWTQELVLTHVYAPKTSENAGRFGSQEILAQKANPLAVAARSTRQENPSRRPGTVSREPDEIQIHIGRIEVTAVQQTSAPAIVKTARKGLSLDEYLKRADRRAR